MQPPEFVPRTNMVGAASLQNFGVVAQSSIGAPKRKKVNKLERLLAQPDIFDTLVKL